MSNLVDQMYVVGSYASSGTPTVGNADIVVRSTIDGKSKYFIYGGPTTLQRSDLIQNIMEVKVTDAQAQAKKLHRVAVALDSNVNSGNPIVGQDYELKIQIKQFQDMAEDSIYCKYGFVHVTSATSTTGAFYKAMVESLAKNFMRETTKFFRFGVTDDMSDVGNSAIDYVAEDGTLTLDDISSLTDIEGIVIEELAQPHYVAHMPIEGVNFDVICDEVVFNGDEYIWGTVAEPEVYEVIANGHDLADMEYFLMGERGDQYRDFAPVQHRLYGNFYKKLIDCDTAYDVVSIHYAFIDSLGGTQKSEKDIHLVVEHSSNLVIYGDSVTNKYYISGNSVITNILNALGVENVLLVDKDNNSSSLLNY